MPRGESPGISGEYIKHITGVRMRLLGSGNLLMKLFALDDAYFFNMGNWTMAPSTNIEPFILADMGEQRACFEFKTTQIDEVFEINKIIIFSKISQTMHPG